MDLPRFDTLALELADHVALVELNRPDKANAMNAAMWRELEECFRWCDREPAVRAVVLAARGRHFCAGIDLQMFATLDDQSLEPGRRAEHRRHHIERLQANLTAIEQCRKPVLAAVQYTCIGGGVDMISCCDMRYCTADAYFAIKEIELGMVADVGTLQRLPRLIGEGMARELAYTGRRVEADEALGIRLVNRVFDTPEALAAGVRDIALQIAAKSPLAVRGSKEMITYARDHSVADGLNYIATWNAAMLLSADLFEAGAAAMQKRPPTFAD